MAEVTAPAPRAVPSGHRVFIGNLNYSTSWEALKDICAKEVSDVSFVRIPLRNGRSSGTAIVEFPTVELAELAIRTLNDIEIDGRRIFVKHDEPPAVRMAARAAGAPGGPSGGFVRPARPARTENAPRPASFNESGRKKVSGEDNTSIFLSGLPFSASWQDLKDLCRPYGDVEYADIYLNHERRSRGVGVVRFAEQASVAAAVTALNDTDFRGRVIHVRKYEPRAPVAAAAETAEPAAAEPAAEDA